MPLLAFIAHTLFLADAVVSPNGRTEIVAEIIVSRDPRYVERKFEQLEAAMMRASICHPLQVRIAFLPSTIILSSQPCRVCQGPHATKRCKGE